MHELFDPLANPITWALPFFALTILVELAALKWLDHDDNAWSGYDARDTRTSLVMGLGSLVSTLVFKIGAFVVYNAMFVHLAPVTLEMDTWWSWVLAIAAVDLAYYCSHRFVHRVNVGWAAHQAHHSSEYMNFGTALRQKWNPWFEFFFFLPLPFLGIAPWVIYLAFSINLVYQFFVHTELVDKLWWPVELVMNTPSHHRVHHGSDPEYLDRNYAGIFIVWDRLFGTFAEEKQRPAHGLTKPVDTYNLIRLQYGDYAQIVRNLRSATCWRHRLGYLFGPPGWAPRETQQETAAELTTVR